MTKKYLQYFNCHPSYYYTVPLELDEIVLVTFDINKHCKLTSLQQTKTYKPTLQINRNL